MKRFTKKAFRQALKSSDQTQVWYLCSLKLGKTPTQAEVYDLIKEIANTYRDSNKAYWLAYESLRNNKVESEVNDGWCRRGGYRQYGIRHYRQVALDMLRRLASEPISSYTKVPMFGMRHLYFCSPSYGHKDYNKVRTCLLNGPLATDRNGNRFDPQAAWCSKVLDLGTRIYQKKLNAGIAP